MKKISEPIVFFGSGPVAAASLSSLQKWADIEFVVTKASTKTEMSHIAGDVPVFTANSKKELDELLSQHVPTSRLGILVDYGVIVSQEIIDAFPLGILNSHFSLLPELRGADPISFAVLTGAKRTGVSLMLLVEAMDEGPLLAQTELELSDSITAPELTDELIELSNKCLEQIVPLYLDNQVVPQPQEQVTIGNKEASYTRKLTKSDGIIDWNKPATQIEREIRGFIDWPKSRTTLGGKDVVILKAQVIPETSKPGSVEQRGKQLIIYCGQDALSILILKPAGKKEMPIEAFLAGYSV